MRLEVGDADQHILVERSSHMPSYRKTEDAIVDLTPEGPVILTRTALRTMELGL